ncbi:hypothetical protein N9985_01015 [Gammaproteobacteria bacterium]|nr:hypothetical protein [Gammaproteobacteria bacterium]
MPDTQGTLARTIAQALSLAALLLLAPGLHAAGDQNADSNPAATATQPSAAIEAKDKLPAARDVTPNSPPTAEAAADATAEAPEDATIVPGSIANDISPLSNRSGEIDLLEQQLARFEADEDDARDLFDQYRDKTRIRLWQFAMALDSASATTDKATIDWELLEQQHPGWRRTDYQLPVNIVTVRDLYLDTLDVFFARNRMLALISDEQRKQAVGSELYGMQELRSERDLIIVEVRYQALRIPRAFWQIKRMAVQAPVPLILIAVQFWLAVFLFRWWRNWLPGTLVRMRTSLLAIRPRTEEVLTRLRGLWYINEVRAPLEWLLLLTFLFSLLQFDGLNFVRDVGLIIVRWSMLTWFAVALLNAYIARGAGGLAGESAQLRLKSLRLIAGWLLLLGLSVDLSTNLVGDAALTTWIWDVFQLLILPLICSLLSIWHMELYTRLAREGEPAIPQAAYAAQRGIKRWLGSAKVLGLLVTSWLRAVLISRIEKLGSARTAAGLGLVDAADEIPEQSKGLQAELYSTLIKGHDAFGKYATLERRALVKRINAATGGTIGIVGERGIGKNGFLRQVADSHENETIFLDCRTGSAADLVTAFSAQLGIDVAAVDDNALNAALESQHISFIVIYDLHLLVRPVPGGISGIAELADLHARISAPVTWGMSVDRFAYQLIARLRSDFMLADHLIQLRPWSEDQIGEFIQNRCDSAELQPDFSELKIPRQYMDVAENAVEDRNRAGIYTMLAALSRGNPSIAIRLFADSIRMNDDGKAVVTLPANRDDQLLKNRSINLLLVLRVIAQVELITFDDIASNLRFEPSVITSSLQFALLNNWVEERNGRYRISWPWFRVITQVLARQNLLAGFKQENN